MTHQMLVWIKKGRFDRKKKNNETNAHTLQNGAICFPLMHR